jgi:hypothetical protein
MLDQGTIHRRNALCPRPQTLPRQLPGLYQRIPKLFAVLAMAGLLQRPPCPIRRSPITKGGEICPNEGQAMRFSALRWPIRLSGQPYSQPLVEFHCSTPQGNRNRTKKTDNSKNVSLR